MTSPQPPTGPHSPTTAALREAGTEAHIARLQALLDDELNRTLRGRIVRRLASQWIRATRSPGRG